MNGRARRRKTVTRLASIVTTGVDDQQQNGGECACARPRTPSRVAQRRRLRRAASRPLAARRRHADAGRAVEEYDSESRAASVSGW